MKPDNEVIAYSVEGAAKVTGRSKTRIKTAIRNKELTAHKDGRATVIMRVELARWLEAMPIVGRELLEDGNVRTAEP